jgi:hypothetical protein
MTIEKGFDRVKSGPQRRWHWVGIGLATSRVNP